MTIQLTGHPVHEAEIERSNLAKVHYMSFNFISPASINMGNGMCCKPPHKLILLLHKVPSKSCSYFRRRPFGNSRPPNSTRAMSLVAIINTPTFSFGGSSALAVPFQLNGQQPRSFAQQIGNSVQKFASNYYY